MVRPAWQVLEAISKLLCRASKILRFAQNDIEEPSDEAVTLSVAKGLGLESSETASRPTAGMAAARSGLTTTWRPLPVAEA